MRYRAGAQAFKSSLIPAHESLDVSSNNKLVTGYNLFEHADRLDAAIEPFPDVMIVITSSWRENFNIEALKGFLPPSLAERVIGITPQMFSRDGAMQRVREIHAFLEDNDLLDIPWIALDDHGYKFGSINHPNLIFCDGKEGFTDDVAAALTKRLRCIQEEIS